MEKQVYVCLLEVVPLAGCELDPLEHAGAMVRCYVLAEDADRATRMVMSALTQDRFKIVQVEWCVADSETEWESLASSEATPLIAEAERAEWSSMADSMLGLMMVPVARTEAPWTKGQF